MSTPQRRDWLALVGSLLHVNPFQLVQLGALKAAGNPLAGGSAQPIYPGTVALRLVEITGARTRVAIGSELGKVRALKLADLLEKSLQQLIYRTRLIDLHGCQVATVLARLEMPKVLAGSGLRTALAAQAETAQPLYERYWLRNRRSALLGGLLAVA
ncbi:hypothetical protein [Mycobacterium uberis]|uniref:hypothetical protein n=1 Tax=Mycobacterium uberis TaxID=2162698 RepID=UPI001FB4DB3E|nr:hypothetical protein [Mycobacterium uberis]